MATAMLALQHLTYITESIVPMAIMRGDGISFKCRNNQIINNLNYNLGQIDSELRAETVVLSWFYSSHQNRTSWSSHTTQTPTEPGSPAGARVLKTSAVSAEAGEKPEPTYLKKRTRTRTRTSTVPLWPSSNLFSLTEHTCCPDRRGRGLIQLASKQLAEWDATSWTLHNLDPNWDLAQNRCLGQQKDSQLVSFQHWLARALTRF